MEKLLLIKLGGSLITDKGKDFTAKPEIIIRLAREIKSALGEFHGKIIIAHGSGSFGHSVASKYKTQEGIIDDRSLIGLPLVADAAIQINRLVMKGFLKAKLPAVSFSPASLFLANNRHSKKVNSDTVLQSLKIGVLPVLYGDIIFDQKQGFCIFSSETVLSILAEQMKSVFSDIKIIYCGNTDGVYGLNGKILPEITPLTYKQFQRFVSGSDQTDVTGGMLHKVSESLTLAKSGIETNIINGNRLNELKKAILGKKTLGTFIRKK